MLRPQGWGTPDPSGCLGLQGCLSGSCRPARPLSAFMDFYKTSFWLLCLCSLPMQSLRQYLPFLLTRRAAPVFGRPVWGDCSKMQTPGSDHRVLGPRNLHFTPYLHPQVLGQAAPGSRWGQVPAVRLLGTGSGQQASLLRALVPPLSDHSAGLRRTKHMGSKVREKHSLCFHGCDGSRARQLSEPQKAPGRHQGPGGQGRGQAGRQQGPGGQGRVLVSRARARPADNRGQASRAGARLTGSMGQEGRAGARLIGNRGQAGKAGARRADSRGQAGRAGPG